MRLLIVISIIFIIATPGFSLNICFGQGGQYYYSRNTAAAGFTKEYHLEIPLGNGAFEQGLPAIMIAALISGYLWANPQ